MVVVDSDGTWREIDLPADPAERVDAFAVLTGADQVEWVAVDRDQDLWPDAGPSGQFLGAVKAAASALTADLSGEPRRSVTGQ